MANCVVQFPLKTEQDHEDRVDNLFALGRKIYNSFVNVTQKRYKEMTKTKKYRNLISSLSNDKEKDKDIWKQINEMRKQYGMSEYSFHEDVKKMQKHFKDNIDSFTAQKIATTLWKSYDKLFFGNGDKIHYKKYDSLNSLEGKSNKTGIRFKDDWLIWNGLNIPVLIRSEEHTSELQSPDHLVCRLLLEKKKKKRHHYHPLAREKPPDTRHTN